MCLENDLETAFRTVNPPLPQGGGHKISHKNSNGVHGDTFFVDEMRH